MKFVIIGPALSGNKGAAAMLESSIQTLTKKYPDAQFTLLSHYPVADAKLNSYKNLKIVSATPLQLGLVINPLSLAYKIFPFWRQGIKRRHAAIRVLAEADAVLEEGGITFNDGREIYLLFNVATILPALFLGTPVIKCAQALGPFKNPINNFVSKIFLPRMTTIVARGEYTRKNLNTLKLKNVVDGADYAFSLEVTAAESAKSRKYLQHPVFSSKNKLVGVSPSSVIKKRIEKQGLDYKQIMVSFINGLLEKNYDVALLPHSMSDHQPKQSFVVRLLIGKTHNDDMAICRDIYSEITNKDRCMFLDRELGAQPLRDLIGACDLFVASRFHAMVAALSMKVPVMVVGWSHKYAEVLKMFECEELAFDFTNVTAEKMLKNFEKIAQKRDTIKTKISNNLPAVKTLSKRHVEFIEKAINETAR